MFDFIKKISGVISAVNIAAFLIKHNQVKSRPLFEKAVFFIYGLHTIFVLGVVGKIFDMIFKQQNTLILTVRYFFVPIAVAYTCVFVYWIMEKMMPKTLALLSGSR